jgi:predicted nucleotidyltransferase
MPPSEDLEFGYLDVLSTAVEALSIPPLPYCLIGALALGAYGRPRATHDVDLLILTDHATSHSYLDSLRAKGFALASDWHEANPMARDVVMRLKHTSAPDFPLDLIFATSPLHKNTLDRRKLFDLHGTQVSVSSAEDLILLKLSASRPRDFDDVMGIVGNASAPLDLDYLWSWAERLGLQSELHYVLISAKRE